MNRTSFKVTESRKSGVTEGKHYIVLPSEERVLDDEETVAMFSFALHFAQQNDVGKGFRIGINYGSLTHVPYTHIHVIIPSGKDALPRFSDT